MKRINSLVKKATRAFGYELVPHRYYSPVPYDTPRSHWERVSKITGVAFDVDAQLTWFVEAASAAASWAPPDSQMYGPVDAEVLYGAMRVLKPRNVIELGSGTSSEIIHAGLNRIHDIYDPVPNDRTTLPVSRLAATDIHLETFAALGDGDVLFVDTTHTVKTGGDVNYIVLEVLPSLNPGVIVHFHDIFLPYEYPYTWAEEGRLWAEQYLLQAFLSGNQEWDVLCGCMAVAKAHPEKVEELVPRFSPSLRPGAFWLRKRPR